jgi:aspartate carbamoyltransferase catalytic subunit
MRHLLSLREMPAQEITDLLNLAEAFVARGRTESLAGRTLATLFYEPSTRTEISFELAARTLGAGVVRCDVDRSSVKKGESLADTVRTLESLGIDVIAIRHPSAGAAHLAAAHAGCAIINAGDGMHEHPTQGLLDLLTVRRVKGRIAGLRLAIVGDIRHSRVARSAAWGFSKLGASVVGVGPATLLPPTPNHGLPFDLGTSLEEALSGADVVMVLRMQRERQRGGDVPTLAEYTRGWGISSRVLRAAKPDAILLHPGPANLGVELTADAAYGPQSRIAEQVAAGLPVRMATLAWTLGREQLARSGSARRAERQRALVTNGLLDLDQPPIHDSRFTVHGAHRDA